MGTIETLPFITLLIKSFTFAFHNDIDDASKRSLFMKETKISLNFSKPEEEEERSIEK